MVVLDLTSENILTSNQAFVRASTGHYKFHQTGLISLVLRVSKEGARNNDIVRSMFFQLCDWDVSYLIFLPYGSSALTSQAHESYRRGS
jgi:hypothetical protein